MTRRTPRLRYPLRERPDPEEWGPEVDWVCALLLALWINGMAWFFV